MVGGGGSLPCLAKLTTWLSFHKSQSAGRLQEPVCCCSSLHDTSRLAPCLPYLARTLLSTCEHPNHTRKQLLQNTRISFRRLDCCNAVSINLEMNMAIDRHRHKQLNRIKGSFLIYKNSYTTENMRIISKASSAQPHVYRFTKFDSFTMQISLSLCS